MTRRLSWIVLGLLVEFGCLVAPAADRAPADLAPKLSVEPLEVRLKPGQEWVPLKYGIGNPGSAGFRVEHRSARFESVTPGWKSSLIGPFPMEVDLPPVSGASIQDNAYVPIEILQEALKAGALESGKIVLAQTFSFKSNAVANELTARVTFVLDYPASDISPTNFCTQWYEVTTLKRFVEDAQKMAQLRVMLDYADKSHDALVKELGFDAAGKGKIPLWINSLSGSPCYVPTPLPHMSIPWNIVESQDGIQFLFVVYPHELAHYFLMTRFPNPPRWFVEGPASFFAYNVALALGYKESAAHDRKKILGFSEQYKARKCTYCFEPLWPEDQGRNDNPNDVHSYGFGYAYEICLELEKRCGKDFFARAIQSMSKKEFDFSGTSSEHEKNVRLIQAMQSETKEDLWAYFATKGFKK